MSSFCISGGRCRRINAKMKRKLPPSKKQQAIKRNVEQVTQELFSQCEEDASSSHDNNDEITEKKSMDGRNRDINGASLHKY